jgi:hypothetical protein
MPTRNTWNNPVRSAPFQFTKWQRCTNTSGAAVIALSTEGDVSPQSRNTLGTQSPGAFAAPGLSHEENPAWHGPSRVPLSLGLLADCDNGRV